MSFSVRLLTFDWRGKSASPLANENPFECREWLGLPEAPFSEVEPLAALCIASWDRLEDDEEEEVGDTEAALLDVEVVTRCLFRGGGDAPPSSESSLDARLASVPFLIQTKISLRFNDLKWQLHKKPSKNGFSDELRCDFLNKV